VPEAERASRVYLSSDLCAIDSSDFFVRCLLSIPIIGRAETFSFGVWSSLSRENFHRYIELYDDDSQAQLGPMFGWLSNQLPDYPDTLRVKVNVWPQTSKRRPLLEVEATEHPLSLDQREGISLERLLERLPSYWSH
jgi:hypothetical protein